MEALILLLFISLLWSKCSASFAGPYDLVPLQIGKCEPSECEKEQISIDNFKIRRPNRSSYLFSGNINCTVPWDNTSKFTVDLSVWGNGGWKPNFYHMDIDGLCTGFEKYMPSFKEEFLTNINHTCPLPVGFYSVKELNIKQTLNIPSVPYGKYKILLRSYDTTNNCIFCIIYICDCVPRKKRT